MTPAAPEPLIPHLIASHPGVRMPTYFSWSRWLSRPSARPRTIRRPLHARPRGELLESRVTPAAPFMGGVRVAAADVNGDGVADVVAGQGVGGEPRVKIISGKDGSELVNFLA